MSLTSDFDFTQLLLATSIVFDKIFSDENHEANQDLVKTNFVNLDNIFL